MIFNFCFLISRLGRAASHGVPMNRETRRVSREDRPWFTVISRTCPALLRDRTTNPFFRAYPRGSFYPLIFHLPTKYGRFTKSCFRTWAACSPSSQAGMSLYGSSAISIRAKPTLMNASVTLLANCYCVTTRDANLLTACESTNCE